MYIHLANVFFANINEDKLRKILTYTYKNLFNTCKYLLNNL